MYISNVPGEKTAPPGATVTAGVEKLKANMSGYQKFLAEQSSKFIAESLGGVVASGKIIDPKDCVAAAVASAKELYVQLEAEGAV